MPYSAEYYLRLLQRRNAFRSVPQDFVYTYLVDPTGSVDMDVDGSVVPVNFDYIVPAGTVYKNFMFSRINIVMVDGAIRWGQFGGLGGALNNGLLFQAIDNNGVIQQNFGGDQHAVTTNEDFAALAGVDSIISPAAGDDALPVRFSIFKAGNKMTMFPNWRIRVVVQDNLTGISHLHMMVQGILRRDREPVIN